MRPKLSAAQFRRIDRIARLALSPIECRPTTLPKNFRIGHPSLAGLAECPEPALIRVVLRHLPSLRAADLGALLTELARAGVSTTRAIAAELNHRGVKTPNGRSWRQTSIVRLLHRRSALNFARN